MAPEVLQGTNHSYKVGCANTFAYVQLASSDGLLHSCLCEGGYLVLGYHSYRDGPGCTTLCQNSCCKGESIRLLFTILCSQQPLLPLEPFRRSPHSLQAVFCIISRPPPTLTEPEEWSNTFNDFVRTCLQKEPDERPSAKELLKVNQLSPPFGRPE